MPEEWDRKTTLGKKVVTICMKTAGFKLNKNEIETKVGQYREQEEMDMINLKTEKKISLVRETETQTLITR